MIDSTVRARLGLTLSAVAVLALSACSSGSTGSKSTSIPVVSSSAASTSAVSSAAQSSASTSSASETSPTAGGANAIDDTYYPVALGNTWVYRTDYGSTSLGVVTDTEVMTAVVPVSDGNRVTIKRTFHYVNGKTKDFVSTVTYVFHKNGSLTVPFQNGIATAGTTITVKSGNIVWPTPATLESGKPSTGRISVTISTAGRSLDATVDVTLKGHGTASVTVPAGTFAGAQVLDQTLTERLGGVPAPITITSQTYLVKGTGMVKTTIGSFVTGQASTSSVLVSFHHG